MVISRKLVAGVSTILYCILTSSEHVNIEYNNITNFSSAESFHYDT